MTIPRLQIDYITTADMPDGQSLPPFIDEDGAVWWVVRRLPGARTLWRRIRLAPEDATDDCTVGQLYAELRQTLRDKKEKENDNGYPKVRHRKIHQGHQTSATAHCGCWSPQSLKANTRSLMWCLRPVKY